MPADLRAHTRAPEDLFRIQAEIYRTYHMRDPDSFYNRADLWDLATSSQSQTSNGGGTQSVAPVYMVLTLPGETQPEFVLTIPFTPRNKQNLIAPDGDALRRPAPGRDPVPGTAQTGNHQRAAANRRTGESGSE